MKMTTTTTYLAEFTPRELEFLAKMEEMNWYLSDDDELSTQYQEEWLSLMSHDIVTTRNDSICVTAFGIDIFGSHPEPHTYCIEEDGEA